MNYKVAIESLGCSKNLVDAEIMGGLLAQNNYILTKDFSEAEIIIVNTCGFIEAAKEESIKTTLEFAEYKKYGNLKYLIMSGCLAQRYSDDLKEAVPEVDAFIGTTSYSEVDKVITELEGGKKVVFKEDINRDYVENQPRQIFTPSYSAYLKIAEGCDNHCTYCIIPKLRGKYRSRKIEDVVKEAKNMAEKGVKELIVIAQDTSRYGQDLYGEKSLGKLLEEIAKIEGIKWIRVHYMYPEMIDEEMVKVFAKEEKICNYFDIPVQHANDRVLKLMNRKTSKQNIKDKIALIRKHIPNAVIRTSIIVGFPTETQEEFEELKSFVEEVEFDRMGVFAYSKEEDTAAAKLDGQIDEEIKFERRDELMQVQKDISLAKNQAIVGKTLEVIIEEKVAEDEYLGRTYGDSPEIDCSVYVRTKEKLKNGDFVNAEIVAALEYDLIGEM